MPTPIKECDRRNRAHGPHDVGIDNDTVLPCPGTDVPATGQFEVSDRPLPPLRSTPPAPPVPPSGHPIVGATVLHALLRPGGKCPHCDHVAPIPPQQSPTELTAAQQIRAYALTAAAALYSGTRGALSSNDVLRLAREWETYIRGDESDAEAA